jgi:hypothetical protein
MNDALGLIAQCEDEGVWPGYAPEVQSLNFPRGFMGRGRHDLATRTVCRSHSTNVAEADQAEEMHSTSRAHPCGILRRTALRPWITLERAFGCFALGRSHAGTAAGWVAD